VVARLFWLPVPTGTTATFAITWSGATAVATTHYATYDVKAAGLSAALAPSVQNVNTSTDMDVTTPLTTGSQTIATGGAFLAVAVGAATTTKTWSQSTGSGIAADINTTTTNFGFTTATDVTAVTASFLCTGSTNGEDGALAYMIFGPGAVLSLTAEQAAAQKGTVTVSIDANVTLTAGQAAAQTGTLVHQVSPATLTGQQTAGQIASLTPDVDKAFTAQQAAGQQATFGPAVDKPLTAQQAAGQQAPFAPTVGVALSGAQAAGEQGAFSVEVGVPNTDVDLATFEAVAEFSGFVPDVGVLLSAAAAVGEVGDLLLAIDTNIPLVDQEMQGQIAVFEPERLASLFITHFTRQTFAAAVNVELREDLGRELREDGGIELRE
jgi:hypothetical protein